MTEHDPNPTAEDYEASVKEAQAAIVRELEKDPTEWREARRLREAAENGVGGEIMMFALTDLVNREKLVLNDELWVRLAPKRSEKSD